METVITNSHHKARPSHPVRAHPPVLSITSFAFASKNHLGKSKRPLFYSRGVLLSTFSISNRPICPLFDVLLQRVNRSAAAGARSHSSGEPRCRARLSGAAYCAHNGGSPHRRQYLKMVTGICRGFTHCALEDRDGRTMDTTANVTGVSAARRRASLKGLTPRKLNSGNRSDKLPA